MTAIRLSIRHLDKAFNAPVLRDVALDIREGEIHAIVGENGAGKSTLVNILTGLVTRDGGEILLDGEAYDPDSASAAFAAGVSFCAQELSVIETLTVAENISLRRLPTQGIAVDRSGLDERATSLLAKVGLRDILPGSPAGGLSLAERQLVEIAKAVSAESRLLILDEPTAALTKDQADRVHGIVRELAGHGVAVIYISHRLGDVLDIADRVTVIRDGSVVATADAANLSIADLVSSMSGAATETLARSMAEHTRGDLSLVARNLSTADLPHAIDLDCHYGEVLGIAGLAGSGKSELLHAVFGLTPALGGQVIRDPDGQPLVIIHAGLAARNGIGFLGEDRRTMGIFPGLSALTNIMLPDLSRSWFTSLDKTSELHAGEQLRGQLAIRVDNLDQEIQQLSGGNQQKALIARWLNCNADILLLDEPTRGVDIATKNAIYELFRQLRTDGRSLLIASSEIDELLAVCDRIVVMSDRRLVAEFTSADWSEDKILAAAFSQYVDSAHRDRPAASPA